MTLAEIRANDPGYKAAYDSYVKPSTGASGSSYSSSFGGSSGSGGMVNAQNAAANQPGGYTYNPNLDYAANINNAISAGASYSTVQDLLDQRNMKIDNNYDTLGQYRGDTVTQRAQNYINEAKSREALSEYQRYLEEARAAEEAAKRAAVEHGVNNLLAQIPAINQTYDDLAQQAYINNRLGQKGLKNQLSAAGLSGTGVAESSYAAANANYENLLNSGERERANAVQAINNDVENLRATGDISIAENATKYNQMLAEAMRDDYWQNRNYEWNQNQFDQNMAFQQKMADAELVSASDKQKLQLAQLAAQLGNYQPLADLLGMSAADIAASMQTTAGTAGRSYSGGGDDDNGGGGFNADQWLSVIEPYQEQVSGILNQARQIQNILPGVFGSTGNTGGSLSSPAAQQVYRMAQSLYNSTQGDIAAKQDAVMKLLSGLSWRNELNLTDSDIQYIANQLGL